ncbi:DSD1 family PLP-dependent enzyme [Phenylobacterium sp. 20VBR1]|uniref:DSD1 family PLP-dependent enzyme n=1 Tax=Phenylobacterium glaciei TaxID=2803784 RepID=A0A941HUE6_9CAUL|nr:DSD1 family PLP-dependent enzyme [Phenylobacterium glaciei]MBR7618031.1 DSD1 family PLP-dependent enzyme [Phenylobacterium glaciei]
MTSERPLEAITAELGALADRPSTALSLALIGQPGSRYQIPTPAGVIDLDAFDRNVARMAARAKAAGLVLRPHAKSHKCAALARRQIAAGAVGVCCAKLAEAEALSAAGIRGILITSSLAGQPSAARAARLAGIDPDFAITVDHPDGATEIGEAAQAAGVTVRVVLDVDLGMGRTGVASVDQGVAVGAAIIAQPSLKLLGIQGYGGHWQHMAGANERTAAVADGIGKLTEVAAALRAQGHVFSLITGGGTGTFSADAAQGILNEIQAGSYAFMDREYREALGDDDDGAFETSLMVQARVISANAERWVTVDAGLKAFATDGPEPEPLGEAWAGSKYRFFGDEHGMVTRPRHRAVARGERVEFTAPHCDPTIDRYDLLHLVRGDVLVDLVRVEGRGASQ